MLKLIDKDIVKFTIDFYGYMQTWSKDQILSEIKKHIDKFDTIDIVRCSLCRYSEQPTEEFDYFHCNHYQWDCESGWAREVKTDDFCSYGERR